MVKVNNKGKRAVTVQSAGWLDSKCGDRYFIVPQAGLLPATLRNGESVSVIGIANRLADRALRLETLVPYCEDAEGQLYTGQPDVHFKAFVKGNES